MKQINFLPIIFITFFLTCFSSYAQNNSANRNARATFTLSGNVKAGTTSTALNGASIYIADLKTGTATDANGDYTLRNLPAGTYLVQAGFVGYKNILKTVTLNQNTTLDFLMDVSITEENEVVVTAVQGLHLFAEILCR